MCESICPCLNSIFKSFPNGLIIKHSSIVHYHFFYMINNPKHPNISFKEYCQQFTKECNTTKLNKTTFVLGDLNLNKLREQQKEEFK